MTKSTQYQSTRDLETTVTLVVGQTLSTALDTNGCQVVGIRTDANLTGTSLTFKVANTLTGTYLDYHTNTDVSPPAEKQIILTVSPSKHYGFGDKDFTSVQCIKIVSDAVQAGSDSVITLILKP